jgi:hypothetical protein
MTQNVIIYNKQTGFIESYQEIVVDAFEDGAAIGGGSVVLLLTESLVNSGEVIGNSFIKNNKLKPLSSKPSNYHIWNLETEQWEEPENYQQLLFNEAASKVKLERQRLLTATDWTDTVSASTRLENYNAWQFYRQQLRDITKQEGYPFNVIWPTQPV